MIITQKVDQKKHQLNLLNKAKSDQLRLIEKKNLK